MLLDNIECPIFGDVEITIITDTKIVIVKITMKV